MCSMFSWLSPLTDRVRATRFSASRNASMGFPGVRTSVNVYELKPSGLFVASLPKALESFFEGGVRPVAPHPFNNRKAALAWGQAEVDHAMARRAEFLRASMSASVCWNEESLKESIALAAAPTLGDVDLDMDLFIQIMRSYAASFACRQSKAADESLEEEIPFDGTPDLEDAAPADPHSLVIGDDDVVRLHSPLALDADGRAASPIYMDRRRPIRGTPHWHLEDSYSVDTPLFDAGLEAELRAYLNEVVFDDPEITINAATGERVALSELLATGRAHNPPRLHCSVTSGTHHRLRYNQHRQGSRLSDIACRPMVSLLWRASCALQHKVSPNGTSAGDGEDCMLRMALALVVNGYLPGTRVGCHSDNASPGPGGWQHNSQRRQSHVMVATLSSDPRLELPSQLVFSRATPTALEPHRRTTVGAPLNLLNNRGYLLGWRTDSCYQHETVPVGDHAAPELQSVRRYALIARHLELWNEFADRAPYRIKFTEEDTAAFAQKHSEYVQRQRVRLLDKFMRRQAALIKQGSSLDEAAQRASWHALCKRAGVTNGALRALRDELLEECPDRYVLAAGTTFRESCGLGARGRLQTKRTRSSVA